MSTYEVAYQALRARLAGHDLAGLVERSGTRALGPDRIGLRCLGREYVVTYPDGLVLEADGQPAPETEAILLLLYLTESTGRALEGRWVAFEQLSGGAGYAAYDPNASITMTGNRIEWNRNGGIRILGGSHYNITGNYIDRSGGPGISLLPRDKEPCFCLAVTGNLIYRSGKPEWTTEDLESAHVRIEEARGLSFCANTMCLGQDDGGGKMSPIHGIVLRGLRNCVVKDNTLHVGALRELISDLGGHGDGVIIKDNVGSVFEDKGTSIWGSGQI